MFGFLHGFWRISGARSLLNLHNRESTWRRFKKVLAACLENKRETHGDSLKLSSDYRCCRKRRAINCAKTSQRNQFRACNQLHQNAITPRFCFRINCVMFWDITVDADIHCECGMGFLGLFVFLDLRSRCTIGPFRISLHIFILRN